MKKEDIENVKKLYPKGTRVRLICMGYDIRPLKEGSTGTVQNVDDMGTIHVAWDNGRLLGLIKSEDIFEII